MSPRNQSRSHPKKNRKGSGDGLVLIWDDFLLDLNLTIHAHKGSVNTLEEIIIKQQKEHNFIKQKKSG